MSASGSAPMIAAVRCDRSESCLISLTHSSAVSMRALRAARAVGAPAHLLGRRGGHVARDRHGDRNPPDEGATTSR